MKCQRCGNEAVIQEGIKLIDPVGPDATKTLTFEGVKGTIVAAVCNSCEEMLLSLGWAEV